MYFHQEGRVAVCCAGGNNLGQPTASFPNSRLPLKQIGQGQVCPGCSINTSMAVSQPRVPAKGMDP